MQTVQGYFDFATFKAISVYFYWIRKNVQGFGLRLGVSVLLSHKCKYRLILKCRVYDTKKVVRRQSLVPWCGFQISS